MPGQATLELTWKGAAGRPPARFVVLRVTEAGAEGGGLLGLLGFRRSPSMEGYIPDPHRLAGTVVAGPEAGHDVRLRLPRPELQGARPGDLIVLGLVDALHCICLLRVPPTIGADGAAAWAAAQTCR